MPRTYYTLVRLNDDNGFWEIEFGDYIREVVEYEREDMKDHGYAGRELKIIRTNDDQDSITAAVIKLNL